VLEVGGRPKGVPNGSQIASLDRILLAIKERDQIASDFQIASLARSPINNYLIAHITLQYNVLCLLFLSLI
jgi:hypothetical protein